MAVFSLDFDWYDMLLEGGLVKDGYRYYTGQKMHPYIPKMQIQGYTDDCCQMSSITKIHLPKDDDQFQLGEFNHIGTPEEAFYCALLNGLYRLNNKGIKRVLVESSNKLMVCDILNLLFYNKAKRKQYWYTHELMCVLNDFRLFAIKWNPDPRPFHETAHFKKKKLTRANKNKIKENRMDVEYEPEPLDPSIAHMYT